MANKNIRNYTSEVPAKNSINRIEDLLVSAGAKHIGKTYSDEGGVTGFKFLLPVNNLQLTFDINPAVENVFKFMMEQRVNSLTNAQREILREQAERTAWKNQAELIQIQLDMVAVNQVDMMQAMFLSLTDGTETVYEKMKKTNFKALLPA